MENRWLAAPLFAAALCLAGTAFATEEPDTATSRGMELLPEEGGTAWGIFGGYGFADDSGDASDVDVASVGIRWSKMWPLVGTSAVRGHPGLGVEFQPLLSFDQEPDAYGVGANVQYEYHYAPRGRLLPIVRLGVGGIYTDEEVPPGETEFNFTAFAAFALDIAVSRRGALGFEYRLHHISNAGTGEENPGINAHTLLVGFTFYSPR
jgi:hypothetical protein